MAKLSKKQLLQKFEDAVQASGWNLLYRSRGTHPALYTVWQGEQRFRVKAYIWNITFGGRISLAHEYRIQVTGVKKFEPERNGRTLVLGYWDDIDVFAGWDVRQHAGTLGASPSLQISETALQKAEASGFAPYIKGNGETALALSPDFMGTYIQNLESLHDSGKVPKEFEVLTRISDDPEDVDEEEIDDEVAAKRRRALVSTWKTVRANGFGRRVLTAYSHKCAMCGVQLKLVEGAHIVPVGEPSSTDVTANGIALCVLHHRAYDRSLVTFDRAYRVHINAQAVKALQDDDKIAGLPKFRAALRPIITTPPDKRDRPKPTYVDRANSLRGWKLRG